MFQICQIYSRNVYPEISTGIYFIPGKLYISYLFKIKVGYQSPTKDDVLSYSNYLPLLNNCVD